MDLLRPALRQDEGHGVLPQALPRRHAMDRAFRAAWRAAVRPGDTVLNESDVALSGALGGARLLNAACHDAWTGVLIVESNPPMVITHVPMDSPPPGRVNIHGHVHNHARPGDTPHINVCVEHGLPAPAAGEAGQVCEAPGGRQGARRGDHRRADAERRSADAREIRRRGQKLRAQRAADGIGHRSSGSQRRRASRGVPVRFGFGRRLQRQCRRPRSPRGRGGRTPGPSEPTRRRRRASVRAGSSRPPPSTPPRPFGCGPANRGPAPPAQSGAGPRPPRRSRRRTTAHALDDATTPSPRRRPCRRLGGPRCRGRGTGRHSPTQGTAQAP